MTDPTERPTSMLRSLGPGLLFAGAAVGVSHLVQATRAGADFGLTLVWLVVLANVLKYPAFEAGARYTAATGQSLLEGYRRRGKAALYLYLAVTLVTMCIVVAAVVALTAGLAATLISPAVPGWAWALGLVVVCCGLLVVGRFRLLEQLMKSLMVVLTVATLVAVVAMVPRVDPSRLTLWPPWPQDVAALGFLAALVGWMPSAIDVAVWQSLWGLEKARTEGRRIRLREALFDFRVGYVATGALALGFVFLGAATLHTPGDPLPKNLSAAAFAGRLVDVYAQALGEWARPVISVAGFATMFSTTLSVLDGFPRALETAVDRLRGPEVEAAPRSATYWGAMAVCGVGGLTLMVWFAGSLTVLVDVATVMSFLTAPVLAALNLRAVTGAEVPAADRPCRGLLALHWVGLVLMALFAAAYCVFRLT